MQSGQRAAGAGSARRGAAGSCGGDGMALGAAQLAACAPVSGSGEGTARWTGHCFKPSVSSQREYATQMLIRAFRIARLGVEAAV